MGFLSRLLMPVVVGDQPQSQPSPQSQPPQHAQTESTQSQMQQTRTNQTPQPQQQQQQQQQQQPLTATLTATRSDLTPLQRNLKEFSLFLFGAGFMAASVAVTRRAVIRRQREALPRFFSQSNRTARQLDGADRSALAAQAFGLATLNVASFGVMLTGGIAWAFDLCSVGDLRERTQAALRRPVREGLLNPEDERQMEDMMDSLLQRLGMDVSKEDAKGGEEQQQQQSLESTK